MLGVTVNVSADENGKSGFRYREKADMPVLILLEWEQYDDGRYAGEIRIFLIYGSCETEL